MSPILGFVRLAKSASTRRTRRPRGRGAPSSLYSSVPVTHPPRITSVAESDSAKAPGGALPRGTRFPAERAAPGGEGGGNHLERRADLRVEGPRHPHMGEEGRAQRDDPLLLARLEGRKDARRERRGEAPPV